MPDKWLGSAWNKVPACSYAAGWVLMPGRIVSLHKTHAPRSVLVPGFCPLVCPPEAEEMLSGFAGSTRSTWLDFTYHR